ncbi:MAG: DUF357 domain-containing protein [Candidatus Altiarchaeales archaeon]|nr:DUF357 domain-containing protein [Candidatus Altiarchaeales archaeon]MBD3416148.1 DUF357 domain-containing protein [Candidatus Altiarchaeales archaeon]
MTSELRERLERYLEKAESSFNNIESLDERGEKVRDSALRYYKDALHFRDNGEYVNAFAALEYAEGWLDAGVVVGVVKAAGKTPDMF